ncbi:MAG: DNA-processing protein DprA [Alphaproteobacteria bacterium]|nr:DNA-processing protein DprA [Alphaproteobacteria bacterium]
MADKQKIIAALRLLGTPRIGVSSYMKLVREYGSEEAALQMLARMGKYAPAPVEQAEDVWRYCADNHINILHYADSAYPQALKSLDDFPPLLYAKGRIDLLNPLKSAAIVGARSASINGCKIASSIAAELASSGVCIISGMARGIDTASHSGALSVEKGATVAVLGTGVDVIYPPENVEIYHRLSEQGCIISEFPLGTGGIAGNFPRRNRIIAALSQVVLVVEAGLKSGSLITADCAVKQGKVLFAVPGTPDASKSSGANYLIKKGAYLAEDAADILPYIKEMRPSSPAQCATPQQKVLVFENNDVNFSDNEDNDIASDLLSCITLDGVSIDDLIRLTKRSFTDVSSEILELEIQGKVQRRSGNRVALVKR